MAKPPNNLTKLLGELGLTHLLQDRRISMTPFMFRRLTVPQQTFVLGLEREYAALPDDTRLLKLLSHAIRYAVDWTLHLVPRGPGYSVSGDHGSYHVVTNPATGQPIACDCPLATGTGSYAGRASRCSHQDAVAIMLAD